MQQFERRSLTRCGSVALKAAKRAGASVRHLRNVREGWLKTARAGTHPEGFQGVPDPGDRGLLLFPAEGGPVRNLGGALEQGWAEVGEAGAHEGDLRAVHHN